MGIEKIDEDPSKINDSDEQAKHQKNSIILIYFWFLISGLDHNIALTKNGSLYVCKTLLML